MVGREGGWGGINGTGLGHEDGAAITLQTGFELLRETQLVPSDGTHQKLPLVNPPIPHSFGSMIYTF